MVNVDATNFNQVMETDMSRNQVLGSDGQNTHFATGDGEQTQAAKRKQRRNKLTKTMAPGP